MKNLLIVIVILIPSMLFAWDIPDECDCLIGTQECNTATYYDTYLDEWRQMVYCLCINTLSIPPTVSISCYGVEADSGLDFEDYDWGAALQVLVPAAGQRLAEELCPHNEGDTLRRRIVTTVDCANYTLGGGPWPEPFEVYRIPCGVTTVCTYYFDIICKEDGSVQSVTLVDFKGRDTPCPEDCDPNCGW